MCSNFLWPCILGPTRTVTNNRPSIIGNTFINTIDRNIDSGNIIDKVPGHMPNIHIHG